MTQTNSAAIFLSVGRYSTHDENIVIEAIRRELESTHIQLRMLSPSDWDEQTPVRRIQALMNTCQGVVVVAFPRIHTISAFERSNAPYQRAIGERLSPTVWLQIEATLAIGMRLPTLILVDDRLHPEGLLNPKHAGYNAHLFRTSECKHRLPTEIRLALATLSQQASQETRSGTSPASL